MVVNCEVAIDGFSQPATILRLSLIHRIEHARQRFAACRLFYRRWDHESDGGFYDQLFDQPLLVFIELSAFAPENAAHRMVLLKSFAAILTKPAGDIDFGSRWLGIS